jgi:hypothetical protein
MCWPEVKLAPMLLVPSAPYVKYEFFGISVAAAIILLASPEHKSTIVLATKASTFMGNPSLKLEYSAHIEGAKKTKIDGREPRANSDYVICSDLSAKFFPYA